MGWARERIELLSVVVTMVGTAVGVAVFVGSRMDKVEHQVELLRKDFATLGIRVDRGEHDFVKRAEMDLLKLRVDALSAGMEGRVVWAAAEAWIREFAARNPTIQVPALVR